MVVEYGILVYWNGFRRLDGKTDFKDLRKLVGSGIVIFC